MPEIPDIEAYIAALRPRILGEELQQIRLVNPFLLRTVDRPLSLATGRKVTLVERLGKRIVLGLEGDLYLVLHLMIAGRLQWKERDSRVPRGMGLVALDFATGSLLVTEAGKKRRASLHVVAGGNALAELDPGGLEVIGANAEDFREALLRENHTLKRALTDPRILSGIGNAYSDEILHRARLSPLKHTRRLTDDEMSSLYAAAVGVLREWTDRLVAEAESGFPTKVTAFRPDMAVHGRFGLPCWVCGTPIQRIRYAENESNYCPRCQTGGRLLADRALSRLLKEDRPKTIQELEERRPAQPAERRGDGGPIGR